MSSEEYSSRELFSSFERALAAMDRGDVPALRELLSAHPALAHFRVPHPDAEPLNYFSGAQLLHHVAGNPNRGDLPASIVESASALLAAGADPNARTLSGSTTIGLIITSKDASQAGVAAALIEVLQQSGANDDLQNEETLLLPLRNVAPETAMSLWRRGYPAGLRALSGLGQTAMVRELLQNQNPPQRELDEALTYAVAHRHREIADLLMERGANINSIPAVYGNPGTALHIAPDLEMAQLLVGRGADLYALDPTFGGTPLGWAEYGGNAEVAEFLRACMAEK